MIDGVYNPQKRTKAIVWIGRTYHEGKMVRAAGFEPAVQPNVYAGVVRVAEKL